jgi:hypothetical protein
MITHLEPNQVFVFGSNAAGRHAAGAARQAVMSFGAIEGQGEGLQGQSYAIPTMNGDDVFEQSLRRFVAFASSRPDLTFFLTKVGCGIAGYTEGQVQALLAAAAPNGLPANIVKPAGW